MSGYFHARRSSFKYAFEGLQYLLRTQPNARIHFVITVAAIFFGIVLNIPASHWIGLAVVTGLVWVAELFNTAIEAIVDLVSPQRHQLAKAAKDVAAAAVLLAAITAVAVGLFIFGPPLWSILTRTFSN